MFNIDEIGDRIAGRTTELIMRWIDICTDPAAHKLASESAIATNSHAHRDQLVTVWIEQCATLPRTAH
jgi:hypothetical protein